MAIKQNNNITPQFDFGTTNIRKMYYGSNLVYDPNIPIPTIITTNLQQWLDGNISSSNPGSGTTWNDISGNSRNATLTNGAAFATSGGVSYVDLDGTDDFIDCGDYLSNPYNPFSIQGWVSVDANLSNTQVFFSKWDDVGNKRQWIIANKVFSNQQTAEVGFLIDATGNFSQVIGGYSPLFGIITTNTYYNFALTYDGQTARIYTNGVLQGSAAYGSPTNLTNQSVNINLGRDGQGRYLNGRIGQFLYYSAQLSDTQVLNNYNASKAAYGL